MLTARIKASCIPSEPRILSLANCLMCATHTPSAPSAVQPGMSAARAPPRRPQRTTAGTFAAKSAYSSDFQLNGNGYYQQEAEDPVRRALGPERVCVGARLHQPLGARLRPAWLSDARPAPRPMRSTPASSSCRPPGWT